MMFMGAVMMGGLTGGRIGEGKDGMLDGFFCADRSWSEPVVIVLATLSTRDVPAFQLLA